MQRILIRWKLVGVTTEQQFRIFVRSYRRAPLKLPKLWNETGRKPLVYFDEYQVLATAELIKNRGLTHGVEDTERISSDVESNVRTGPCIVVAAASCSSVVSSTQLQLVFIIIVISTQFMRFPRSDD